MQRIEYNEPERFEAFRKDISFSTLSDYWREQPSFFVVVRDRPYYDILKRQNQSLHHECKWFNSPEPRGSPQPTDDGAKDDLSSIHTVSVADVSPFGVIKIASVPHTNLTRKRAIQSNAFSFSFGRMNTLSSILKRSRSDRPASVVDFAMCDKADTQVPREGAFNLFYSPKDRAWCIFCNFGHLTINDYELYSREAPFALHPENRNVVVAHDRTLEFWCNPDGYATDLSNSMRTLRISSTASWTLLPTVTASASTYKTVTQSVDPPKDRIEPLYMIKSQENWEPLGEFVVPNSLAMHPRYPATRFIAEKHKQDDIPALKELIKIFARLDGIEGIFRPERLVPQPADPFVYLLTPITPFLISLKDEHRTSSALRKYLPTFCDMLRKLHLVGIAHNDIKKQSLLIRGPLFVADRYAVLSGCSKGSAFEGLWLENDQVLKDWFDLLKAVSGCMTDEPQRYWTGCAALDDLYHLFTLCAKYDKWAEEAPKSLSHLPTEIIPKYQWQEVPIDIHLSFHSHSRELSVKDATALLSLHCFSDDINALSSDVGKTTTAIERLFRKEDSTIGYVCWRQVCLIMRDRYKHEVDHRSIWPKLENGKTANVTVKIRIPWLGRYGLCGIGALRHILKNYQPMIALPAKYYFVRAAENQRVGGIYAKKEDLLSILSSIGSPTADADSKLRVEQPRDSSLDEFTYPDHWLVAPHESSPLYLLGHSDKTGDELVHLSPSKGSQTLPWTTFVNQYFDPGTAESCVKHDLHLEAVVESEPCDQSVASLWTNDDSQGRTIFIPKMSSRRLPAKPAKVENTQPPKEPSLAAKTPSWSVRSASSFDFQPRPYLSEREEGSEPGSSHASTARASKRPRAADLERGDQYDLQGEGTVQLTTQQREEAFHLAVGEAASDQHAQRRTQQWVLGQPPGVANLSERNEDEDE